MEINNFADKSGFKAVRDGNKVVCNRYGETKPRLKIDGQRQKQHVHKLKCCCKRGIYFTYCLKKPSPANKHTKDTKGPVRISKVISEHNNGCLSEPDKQIEARAKSESYVTYYLLMLKDLLKFMDVQPYVPSNVIRELLTQALPGRKSISSQDVYNTRIRAKLLLHQLHLENKDYNSLEYDRTYIDSMLKGLDEESDDIIDKCIFACN